MKFKNFSPKIDETAFIAKGAVVVGDCEIMKDANIWYNCVLRGDSGKISVGKNTNIQDCTVVHSHDGLETKIGKNVTIGHLAIIHACEIKDNCLIGMGSVVLDGVVISENSIVGASALVTKGKVFPPNSLIMGSPAKVVRELTPEEISSIKSSYEHYVELGREHKKNSV